MKWQPIEDFPSSWEKLANPELPPLVTVWSEDDSGGGELNTHEIEPLADSPFQFSYADEKTALTKRFKQWLEDVIVNGLEYWNKSL